MKILKDYILGDMVARYLTDEDEWHVGLMLLPADSPVPSGIQKNQEVDSLVQIKIAGDIYDEAYAMGNTMRNGETVRALKYKEQRIYKENDKTVIETVLQKEREYGVVHTLVYKEDTPYIRIFCRVENVQKKSFMLEMFESFSLCGLSPYLEGDGYNQMRVHRIRSVWSQEGRLETIPLEDLQLDPAWDPHAVRCEKFGQAGSMPVNKFFPFVALEDAKNQIFWGAQIAHNASWQMELYRKDDGLSISGGLADRDFGHWMKEISPGECFQTPEAIISVAHTDSIDLFTGRLTKAALESRDTLPDTEKDLPIIFNEYCTTWGNPSHENICRILDAIKGKGFRYFVIDCGWYKEKDVPWDIGMGDYEVSKELFPEGLGKTTEAIRNADMIPGIWFEYENVGKAARIYQQENHLLHKDGKVLTSYFRRFFDMSDSWVEDYLTKKVIGTLKKYNFGYMKIDYNETIGIGCDGAESLGEGLRRNMELSRQFLRKIKKQVPQIVLENCASGGHRLEPSMMAEMSMASFSDAHECREIPIIAANLHRVIHPSQSQIWAVIRETDSVQRIIYSIANTFLGRMCISGDVTNLNGAQWKAIDDGMAFYRDIAPIIADGQSYHYGTHIRSVRHPEGWQALLRIGNNKEAYLVMHIFGGELPEEIILTLPDDAPKKIVSQYADGNVDIRLCEGKLFFKPEKNDMAAAIYLR